MDLDVGSVRPAGPGAAPPGNPGERGAWEPAPPAPAGGARPATWSVVPPLPPPAPGAVRRRTGVAGTIALVVLSALVGGGGALGVARATGWGERTVVQRYVTGNAIASAPADIPGILARVLPSVVSITATTESTSPFFGTGTGTAVTTAEGTGVIVSAAGEIVTNAHVVSGATSIAVTLDGSTAHLTASLLGTLADQDLALIQVHGAHGLTPAHLAPAGSTVVGDGVVAVGYALGLSGGPTVTAGIVSAVGRAVVTRSGTGTSVVLQDMLQTDAAISSGNSGGPLVGADAAVVGIDTAVATSTASVTAQNIGFAIPASTVERLLPVLRRGGASA